MTHVASMTLPADWALRDGFARVAARGKDLVWLDSAVGHSERGGVSRLALALRPVATAWPDVVAVRMPDGTLREQASGAPWARCAEAFDAWRAERRDSPLGWVGVVSYEAGVMADPALPARTPAELPWAPLTFCAVRAAVEVRGGVARVVAEGRNRAKAQRRCERWFKRLTAGAAPQHVAPTLTLDAPPDAAGYRAAVSALVADIHAGRMFQACCTLPLWLRGPDSLVAAYLALRAASPGDFSCYVRMGDIELASTSPERFVALSGGDVIARPMKGTRRRVRGAEAAITQELRASEKDRAENVMIVDLLRNDLNRVCTPGSVHVPALFDVEAYETVLQMTSTVRGTLRAGLGFFDVLQAAFPPGSMTGAPKVEACHALREHEREPRGAYAGSVVWLGYDGDAHASVVIRTLQRWGERLRWDVGGGIVADSDPDREWDEALAKAAPLTALGVSLPV